MNVSFVHHSFFRPAECACVHLRWVELAAITTGIALTLFLSTKEIFPTFLLQTAAITVIGYAVMEIVDAIVMRIAPQLAGEIDAGSDNADIVTYGSPLEICVGGPIIEEGIYRLCLQGGLSTGLQVVLPSVSLLGIPFSAVMAMGVASAVFGYQHLGQIHACYAGLIALSTFSPLFYFYGMRAACFSHVIHNTLCVIRSSCYTP